VVRAPRTRSHAGPRPISVVILDSFLTVTAVAAPRLLIRALDTLHRFARPSGGGACSSWRGRGREMILRELQTNLSSIHAGRFIDDDPRKQNHRLNNVPVLGPCPRSPRSSTGTPSTRSSSQCRRRQVG